MSTNKSKDYLQLSCTECGAMPNEKCIGVSANNIVHLERVKAALLRRVKEKQND